MSKVAAFGVYIPVRAMFRSMSAVRLQITAAKGATNDAAALELMACLSLILRLRSVWRSPNSRQPGDVSLNISLMWRPSTPIPKISSARQPLVQCVHGRAVFRRDDQ
ncbi:hypothetical protein LCM4573_17350 [Rhizobium sp. LCM 4573]|nr:hypothetical protein LCM4573_17350 [Rhizobium sp. LCM 4573]